MELPEYLRRRPINYASAPQGLLSQQAYQLAGAMPQAAPQSLLVNDPLPAAPATTGGGGSGGGAAAGLGGLLGGLGQLGGGSLRDLLNPARSGGPLTDPSQVLNPNASLSELAGLSNSGVRPAGGMSLADTANANSLSSMLSPSAQPGLLSLGSLGNTGLGATATGVHVGAVRLHRFAVRRHGRRVGGWRGRGERGATR
jgi:hypothetical protein